MSNVKESFFALIRNEICGEPLPNDREYDVGKLLRVALKHDVANLIADALLKNGKIIESDALFKTVKKQRSFAIAREAQRVCFYEKIRASFTENKIPFVPLKGTVLSTRYPESWMRTSCDVDILVREEDFDKAKSALINLGFTTDGIRHYHDVAFNYGDKFRMELHFNVCEQLSKSDEILKYVWDYTEKVAEYEYRETAEFFVFHHIAHMAYHFLVGGCGIRPFIDLYLMRKKGFYSEEKLLPLLDRAELSAFYRAVCKLAGVWLNGEEYDDLSLQMEDYVIKGGAFGIENNALAVETVSSKGRKRLLLAKAFPSYDVMCDVYPSLIGRKWVLPFYYLRRGFAKLFGKDRKRTKEIVSRTMSQSKSKNAEVGILLNRLGLKREI